VNRERAKELLPIIEHFANGGKVEGFTNGLWSVLNNPSWDAYDRYRIKPLECLVNVDSFGDMISFSTKAEANLQRMTCDLRFAVHMREVEE
jgi:hypothetical protein